MKTVTIEVADRARTEARFLRAMNGQPQGEFITFASVQEMWRALSPNRWAIVQALCGAGPVSLREVARRVGRDVKAVHTDVHALINAGVLGKTADGRIEFGYDAVHVEFMLKAA